ncbi:hypothetical protein P691DRAFT_757610 [Macrolepiota fuliginosa MF-IS2]|uniref:BTB domain-containing protein n=1 Tax=Macrolepiota fuliginosa MF-IS2 TaxID=1400762 RepID=A0A9P6C6R8_9AGAR|nr:hypothetical protein P691DRAFT_757610 [Macrolepiota fuliginosa MF-IS2]
MGSTPNQIPTRDQAYYFLDGSCVIQVQDHLFRVHRSLLERDSSFFQTVFSLPQATSVAEGRGGGEEGDAIVALEGHSDGHPIICQDSVDDFRALCWALYARPKDIIAQQKWLTVDIPRLIRIISMTHKYEYEHFEDWSWETLDAHSTTNADQFIPRCGGWVHVQKLLILCYQSGRLPFAQRLENEWLNIIRTSDASESRIAFDAALDAAEGSSYLRRFHGKAYYAYLKGIRIFQQGPVMSIANSDGYVDLGGPSTFNEPRRIHLCQGFWSLARLRSKLYTAPKIDDNPSCNKHTKECKRGWEAWWNEASKSASNDPGEFIQGMVSKLSGNSSMTYKNKDGARSAQVPCSNQLKEGVRQMAKIFDDSIPDHFLIPRD